MTTLKCVIVDDETHAILQLENLIFQVKGLKLVGKYTRPLIALNDIRSGRSKPDLLFLDADMPEISGIQFINMIARNPVTTIFYTGHLHFAIPAFETEAVAFLLKPVSQERFLNAVEKARRKHEERAKLKLDSFFIETEGKGKFMKIEYDDVFFLEAAGNYLSVNLATKHHLTHLSLNEALAYLPENIFLRVHKTFIINIQKIKIVEGDTISLNNSKEIPIGAVYKPIVMEVINEYLMHKRRGSD